jgi:tetratricopeptide (TPR) repeat protein
MRSTLLAAAAVLSLGFSTLAFAAGGGGSDSQPIQSTKPVDPNFTRAKAMIETNKDYANALPLLQQVVAKDPRNADAYNLMGYATRKSGNANGSLQYYQQALAIDPRHLGAYEYLGEAYLMLDRPAEADQMLARLDSLCVFGCSEYRMLKAAVANYKKGQKPTN